MTTEEKYLKIYYEKGLTGVCEQANKDGLEYYYCGPCDTDTPTLNNDCAACGQPKLNEWERNGFNDIDDYASFVGAR